MVFRDGSRSTCCAVKWESTVIVHRLHPEGKHLARRHREPDEQTITEPAIAKRLIRTAILEMMAADSTSEMSLGAMKSNVYGKDKPWPVQLHDLSA